MIEVNRELLQRAPADADTILKACAEAASQVKDKT